MRGRIPRRPGRPAGRAGGSRPSTRRGARPGTGARGRAGRPAAPASSARRAAVDRPPRARPALEEPGAGFGVGGDLLGQGLERAGRPRGSPGAWRPRPGGQGGRLAEGGLGPGRMAEAVEGGVGVAEFLAGVDQGRAEEVGQQAVGHRPRTAGSARGGSTRPRRFQDRQEPPGLGPGSSAPTGEGSAALDRSRPRSPTSGRTAGGPTDRGRLVAPGQPSASRAARASGERSRGRRGGRRGRSTEARTARRVRGRAADDPPAGRGRRVDRGQPARVGQPAGLGGRAAEEEVDAPPAIEDARGPLARPDRDPGDRPASRRIRRGRRIRGAPTSTGARRSRSPRDGLGTAAPAKASRAATTRRRRQDAPHGSRSPVRPIGEPAATPGPARPGRDSRTDGHVRRRVAGSPPIIARAGCRG